MPCTNMSSSRPSLFSKSSLHKASDAESSRCSNHATSHLSASENESSDISEDEPDDYFDMGLLGTGKATSSPPSEPLNRKSTSTENIQKQPILPQPASTSGDTAQPTKTTTEGQDSTRNNIFFISNSPSSPQFNSSASVASKQNLERKDSLFHVNGSHDFHSSGHSSSVSSNDLSDDSDFHEHHVSLINDLSDPPILDAKSMRSTKSTKSGDDNDSEWMSFSSDGEASNASPRLQPISFTKRMPIPQPSTPQITAASPTDSSTKGSPSSLKPRSLLSGLFISGMSDPQMRSPSSTKSAHFASRPPKPVLKRSSTTGVITVDNTGAPKTLQKPSLLFSKRYSSFSDVDKNVHSHRSPVLYIAEEDSIIEGIVDDNAKDTLFAKQTSSVGLSNYIAVADNTSRSSTTEMNSSLRYAKSPTGADATLSSSLSKYSSVYNGGKSLKSMLSKSSINISSLLGSGISGLRPHANNRSFETLKSLNSQSSTTSHKHSQQPPQHMADSFAEHLSQRAPLTHTGSDATITTARSVKVEPQAIKSFTPSVEMSESLKDSLMIDHKLGKAPLPDRVISDRDILDGLDNELFSQDSNDYHSKGW